MKTHIAVALWFLAGGIQAGEVAANAGSEGEVLGPVLVGGSAEQAARVIIGTIGTKPDDAPPCRFTGALRAVEIHPSFGSGLRDAVFQPLDLVPGATATVDLPFSPAVAADPRRELYVTLERSARGQGPCRPALSVIVYDVGSGRTVSIDRYTFGLERAAAVRRSPLIGYFGGSADQTARTILTLAPHHDGPRCEISGAIVWQALGADGDTGSSSAGGDRRFKLADSNSPFPSVVFDDLPFAELGSPGARVIDSALSIQFDRLYPESCLRRLSAAIQVFDDTGRTQTSQDRVFFNYHHFDN